MDNPRFPHTLTINRPKKENGATVFDENGNVIYEPITIRLVNMASETRTAISLQRMLRQ